MPSITSASGSGSAFVPNPPNLSSAALSSSSWAGGSDNGNSSMSQPKLIHLRGLDSDVTGESSYSSYPIYPGVTMLGTGKGCVKSPDIVLQGSGVAPQHCFIERLDVADEVILHPISELTIVDNCKVYGPTPLSSGNVISIGESHSFRYEAPQRHLMMNQYPHPHPHHQYHQVQHQQYNSNSTCSSTPTTTPEEESPYAVIRPGPGNPSLSAGDVNRNSSRTMGLMETPSVMTQGIHPKKLLLNGNGNENPALPQSRSTLGPDFGNGNGKQFRDGLESEGFVNKVARFEYLTHHNGGAGNNHNYPIVPVNHGGPKYSRPKAKGLSYSEAGDYSETPNTNNASDPPVLTSPSPYYNGYNSRRPYYTNFNNNNNTPKMRNPYNTNAFNNNYTEEGEASSPSLSLLTTTTTSHSSPSPPDSLYSSHSSSNNNNNPSTISPSSASYFYEGNETGSCSTNGVNGHQSSTESPSESTSGGISESNTIRRNFGCSWSSSAAVSEQSGSREQHEREIACEYLLEMKRKQAEEARLSAQATERAEKLRLDEILAMCLEYEEQISREIEEKAREIPKMHQQEQQEGTNADCQSQDLSSLSSYSPGESQGCPGFNRQDSLKSNSKPFSTTNSSSNSFSSTNASSPTTSGHASNSHSYSRIKTNGSLPREKKAIISLTQQSQSPVLSTINHHHQVPNSSQNGREDSSTSFASLESNPTSLPSSMCASFMSPQNSFSDDVFSPTSLSPDESKLLSPPADLKMIRSPYENVYLVSRNGSNFVAAADEPDSPSPSHVMKSRIRTLPSLGITVQNHHESQNGYIRRPIITTVVEPNKSNGIAKTPEKQQEVRSVTPPSSTSSTSKSKLSVSFSNSVVEFDDKSPTGLSPKVLSSPPESSSSGRLKSSPTSASTMRSVAAEVEVHVAASQDVCGRIESPSHWNSNHTTVVTSSPNNVQQIKNSNLNGGPIHKTTEGVSASRSSPKTKSFPESFPPEEHVRRLKVEISSLEQQEMEALAEMEMEKALLIAEEKSVGSQLESEKIEVEELKRSLAEMELNLRRWRELSLDAIFEIRTKLRSSEKELQGLEEIHSSFRGSTDEETVLLEKIKGLHELVETQRKAYEDAEFRHMEEEVDKEAQKDDLSKALGEAEAKLSETNGAVEQLKAQSRLSFTSSSKEIQNLEKRRQELIKELQRHRETMSIADNASASNETSSDSDDGRNVDLEEKLRTLTINTSAADNAEHIEKIKSRSPIDPQMGTVGLRTYDTLREIERNREFHLNEQGVQMLEEERKRVRQLQKRVQDAVREEWEASRKTRNNQCQSLNSVGSEDSTQTISDTPTDSGGNSDDTSDKSATQSFSTTDMSLNGNGSGRGQNSYDLCQQMRQKQRDMSQGFEDTRPLSDGSAYENGGSKGKNPIVTLREKHRVQNRPLTRYLPVRGDEDHFDLRAHIESSGHQLELCPQVIVTATAARGTLSKLGSRFHNWNKRWFVFDRETRTLSYYIDKSEKKPRGGIHFQAIEDVYVDHLQSVKSPNPKLTFCVKTYNRIFHLLAPSPESMRIWIDIIFTGAEGYQEFKCGA